MTGINASKIIQNLQFVNSFGALKLRAVEDFFDFQNWFRKPGGPPPADRGPGVEESRPAFNGTLIRDRVPLFRAIAIWKWEACA